MGTDVVQEIKSRLDIVEVVSSYVPLKRVGRNFVGLCPFHIEKTPSFTVSPDKQIFYCFGCGKGGDVIKFIQLMEGVEFGEALAIAAEQAGVELEGSPLRKGEREKRNRLKSIQEHLASAFSSFLRSELGAEARNYLKSRGIRPLWWEVFRIGYVPEGIDVASPLLKRGFSREELVETGTFYPRGSSLVCRFTGRVVIPITDFSGDVVAFGGRVVGKGEPKYLNSPETPIFKKGKILFGFHQAKEGIRQKDRAILVEGYMDAIRMHVEGFAETVASLGTALTKEQARRLASITRNIYILYDGDQAGRKASLRAASVFYSMGVEPKVVLLPEGMDPDDFLRVEGPSSLSRLMEKAVSPVDMLLEGVSGGSLSRKEAVEGVFGLLEECEDRVVVDSVLAYVSDRLGMPLEDLRAGWASRLRPKKKEKGRRPEGNNWEREALLAFVGVPQFWERWKDRVSPCIFKDPVVARLVERLKSSSSLDEFSSSLTDEELPFVAEALFGEVGELPLEQISMRLERLCVKGEVDRLRKKALELRNQGDEEGYRRVMALYMEKLREAKSVGGGCL